MQALTTLDVLYIVLTIFTVIIGTLLAVVLYRVIKILWPITEMVWYYKQVKAYLSLYAQIPLIVKEKILEFISNIWEKKENISENKQKETK